MFAAIDIDGILQVFITGLVKGSIFALIALGYTMVYGILRMINFAHGEVFMLGSYASIIILWLLGPQVIASTGIFIALIITMIVAMVFCSITGFTIERVAYRPLRQAKVLSPLISAIGMSILLQNLVMLAQGNEPQRYPPYVSAYIYESPVKFTLFHSVEITIFQIIILVLCVILMVGLYMFVMKTKIGKAMRTTSTDMKMAQLVGIDINKTISITFVIGSGLAAAGGFLYCMYVTQTRFDIGYLAGMKAFTAAVLGGIGNIPGAMLGGIVIGLSEDMATLFVSADWKDVIAFAVLLLILIFKPTGLLGERVASRV